MKCDDCGRDFMFLFVADEHPKQKQHPDPAVRKDKRYIHYPDVRGTHVKNHYCLGCSFGLRDQARKLYKKRMEKLEEKIASKGTDKKQKDCQRTPWSGTDPR